jgi:hypothetical protein
MHRYVDNARLNIDVRNLANKSSDSPRDLHTARGDSGQRDLLKLRVLLNDLVRDSSKRATNCLRVHDGDSGG